MIDDRLLENWQRERTAREQARDDGTEREFGPGDAFHMPPGHDAWIVGDEASVLLDIGGLKGYATST